jgi:hypothetical protein
MKNSKQVNRDKDDLRVSIDNKYKQLSHLRYHLRSSARTPTANKTPNEKRKLADMCEKIGAREC